MKNLLSSVIVLVFIFAASNLYAKNICGNKGYAIGYFNGMLTSWNGADEQKKTFENIFGATYDNQSIKYELFYYIILTIFSYMVYFIFDIYIKNLIAILFSSF